MEITTTSEFLHRNKIRQGELAEYLGVAKATISRYVNGSLDIPKIKVLEIMNNPYGWDVSMFTDVKNITITSEATGKGKSILQLGDNNNGSIDSINVNTAALQKEIEMLRQQLEEEKKRSDEYWKMIQTLMSK